MNAVVVHYKELALKGTKLARGSSSCWCATFGWRLADLMCRSRSVMGRIEIELGPT